MAISFRGDAGLPLVHRWVSSLYEGLARRRESSKPLAMFAISDMRFLLCYEGMLLYLISSQG